MLSISILPKKKSSNDPSIRQYLSHEELLSDKSGYLHKLAKLTSLHAQVFDAIYIKSINLYAEFVQQLPASEAHHHSTLGGLLTHTLETTCLALTLRRGFLLPSGCDPEELTKKHELWSYAVFTGALLHDIGKVVTDQEIILCDAKGNSHCVWNPLLGFMKDYDFFNKPNQVFYRIRFKKNRQYKTHTRIPLLVAKFIIPNEGLEWLHSDPRVFHAWSSYLTGCPDEAEEIGTIVNRADGISTSENLGADTGNVSGSATKPLHQKLVTALRYLVDQGHLPINRAGAAGFLTGDSIWFVCKRVADALRDHLLTEGHSGIPTKNDRIFDILQEHKLIVPNGEKAIWKTNVLVNDKKLALTMLRFKTSIIWPSEDARPDQFTGQVLFEESSEENLTISADSDSYIDEDEEAQGDSTSYSNRSEQKTTDIVSASASGAVSNDADSNVKSSQSDDTHSSEPENLTKVESLSPAKSLGNIFLSWLKEGLNEGFINYNTEHSRVHIVADGVLLVSPGIFRDFVGHTPSENYGWKNVQKGFQKLNIHEKNSLGQNIHKFIVKGDNRASEINGMLVKEISVIFGDSFNRKLIVNQHIVPKSL